MHVHARLQRNGLRRYVLSVYDAEQGRGQDFSKGGGVTLCQSLSSWRFRHGILQPVFLKKAYKGGVTGTTGPPSLRP